MDTEDRRGAAVPALPVAVVGYPEKMTRRERHEQLEAIGRVVWDFYRRRALWRTGHQIRTGRLPRPETRRCVDCGTRASIYDHRDYFRPRLVAAVCHRCNMRRGPARLSLERVRDHLR